MERKMSQDKWGPLGSNLMTNEYGQKVATHHFNVTATNKLLNKTRTLMKPAKSSHIVKRASFKKFDTINLESRRDLNNNSN